VNQRAGSHKATGWEQAGRESAPLISNYFAVAVVSNDPVAAAEVALGMGRAEAKHRRVVVGDLVGDLAPLASLVDAIDPHGISDTFLYGISLNSIGRNVPGEENLLIMLSGTEPVYDPEIITNRRWERLAAGFGEVGALLLLVLQSDTPGLSTLVEHLNGVVLVRDQELPAAPDALVLARVPSPARLRVGTDRHPALAAESAVQRNYLIPALVTLALVLVIIFAATRYWRPSKKPAPVRAVPATPVVAPAETALGGLL